MQIGKNFYGILEDDVNTIINHNLPWEVLSGCKILVTGGSGFIGSYFIRTLLALHRLHKVSKPVKVIALVRDIESAYKQFKDLLNYRDLSFIQWDLNSIATPKIDNVNYIIHAGSHASPRYYGSDPVGTLLPNSVGTAALLDILFHSDEPKGFLFISSGEVYGDIKSDIKLNESCYGVVDPSKVRACYSESKRMGETMCIAWHHQYKLPTFIARPFHTYGPGLSGQDGRAFADFVFNVVRNENIIMSSDGAVRRAFCYVSDAIAGFFTILLKGNVAQPYNVGNSNGELSILELAELLVALYPEKNLLIERKNISQNGYIPSEFIHLIPDVTKLNALGWNAKIEPVIGFRRMIEAYKYE